MLNLGREPADQAHAEAAKTVNVAVKVGTVYCIHYKKVYTLLSTIYVPQYIFFTDYCPEEDPCKCSFQSCDNIVGYDYCDPDKCGGIHADCPYCCCKVPGIIYTDKYNLIWLFLFFESKHIFQAHSLKFVIV